MKDASVLVGAAQPMAFASMAYVARMSVVDKWIYVDDERFVERGWLHRGLIKVPFGDDALTFPVSPKGDLVKEKMINWGHGGLAEKLWNKIKNSYGICPYFGELAWLESFLEDGHQRLVDLIQAMNFEFMSRLGFVTPTFFASELGVPQNEDLSTRFAQLTRAVGGDVFVVGPEAFSYLRPEPFTREGVEVRLFVWDCPMYKQPWPGKPFLPNMSIIDLVANVGPEAPERLRKAITVGGSKWGTV